MRALEGWLNSSGNRVAAELEERGEQICKLVTEQLKTTYKSICVDPTNPANEDMVLQAYTESPRRMHRIVQVALRLRAVEVIERECIWTLQTLPRYGVVRQNMHAMVRWYFEAARTLSNIDSADRRSLDIIEGLFLSALSGPIPTK
ncbi:MAG: hypothetical protein RLY87_1711 [Chloroflexota bacterium]|jgi:hypothetical protein